jgi:hypothetical protein
VESRPPGAASRARPCSFLKGRQGRQGGERKGLWQAEFAGHGGERGGDDGLGLAAYLAIEARVGMGVPAALESERLGRAVAEARGDAQGGELVAGRSCGAQLRKLGFGGVHGQHIGGSRLGLYDLHRQSLDQTCQRALGEVLVHALLFEG